MSLNLSLDGKEFLSLFDSIITSAFDMQMYFREVGESLKNSTQDRFSSGTDPDGKPWKPLKKSTLKHKGSRSKILVDDGHLVNTITYVPAADGVEIGSPMIYAPVHQFGATIERHAQSSITQKFLSFRDVKVTREDGSTFIRKQFAAGHHKKIVAMARRWTGASLTVIPARPFLGLSQSDLAMMQRKAELYFGVKNHD